MLFLPEELLPVGSINPAADAAGRTGNYVNLKNALMAFVVFYIKQGNAATVACDVLQATSVAGAGAKAVPVVPIWTSLDAATSPFKYTRQTDAASFTTDAAVKDKVVILQIDPAKLDTAGLFNAIAARTGASNAANITSAQVLIVPRYPQSSAVDPLAS